MVTSGLSYLSLVENFLCNSGRGHLHGEEDQGLYYFQSRLVDFNKNIFFLLCHTLNDILG